MRHFILAAVSTAALTTTGRAHDPRAAWAWASAGNSKPAEQCPKSAWAWVSAKPCECNGESPDCPCNEPSAKADAIDKPEKEVPDGPAPVKKYQCVRCSCNDGKSKCTCSTACPSIYASYAEASAKAVAGQTRLIVFIGPVAARQVAGCVVCRVHTLEGDGRARVMVGVPGRPDRQLGRVDLAATATDAEILSVGLPVSTPPVQTQPVGFRAGPAAQR